MNRFWGLFASSWRWVFAVLVIAAWLTRHGGDALHEWLGYGALILASLRLARGVIHHEPEDTSFTVFLLPAVLIAAIFVGLTGWFLTTDRFWTVRWIAAAHWFFAGILLVFLMIHGIARIARRKQSTL